MKFLREHRLKAGWTQAQVAEQLGVQRSTVAYCEKGSREPNINMLRRLSELFGCSVDELLGGTQEPEEKQEPDEAYESERESQIRIIIDATPEEIAELFSRLKGSEVSSENSEDESSAGPSDVIDIRKNRQKFGLTQEELAEKLGVTDGTIAMWETGKRKSNIIMLKKLAVFFQCTTDDLLKDIKIEEG